MSSGKNVFIVGPGFIGWEVLELLIAEGYKVKALVRRKEAGEDIRKAGAEPVLGSLDDASIITEQVVGADVVFHTATADHEASVEAIISGLKKRASRGESSIYLHNSGASVFDDGANGEYVTNKTFSDEEVQKIDSVADSAPHRNVDLIILKAKKELGDSAKIVIFVPPLIYGYNPQHGRLSIQIPYLTRFAIKEGYAGHIGQGKSVISTVHVLDLARAYLIVLHHLEKSSSSDADLVNPYYFTEANGDHEPSWLDFATAIGEGLHKAGKIKDATPRTIPASKYDELFGEATSFIFGLNSRTRAVRLTKLGWKPTEKSWRASFFEDELPQLLKE